MENYQTAILSVIVVIGVNATGDIRSPAMFGQPGTKYILYIG